MALFNDATGEVTAKLVYYGPGLSGKSTNLRWLHEHLPAHAKSRLVSLATQADRTSFFDFVPSEQAIGGLRARIQIYTVPGPVSHESTRRMVLRGCDAVVFVADSQAALLDANAESLRGLRQNLLLDSIDPTIPQVIQYNKRDLPTALPLATLEERLNADRRPRYEAVAVRGEGVEATLRGVVGLLFDRLATEREVRGGRRPAGGVIASATRAPAPVPAAESTEAPRRKDGPPPHDLGPDEWAYLIGSTPHGPVSLDQLVDLVLTSVPEDTPVFRVGLAGWVRAHEVREIAEEIPPPVPVPGARGTHVAAEMPDFRGVPRAVRSVLIVDEDADFRRYLALPLAAQGFTIHEAADGAAAWQMAVQHRPWMILADVSMPELDGFELCRRVRSHLLLSRRPLLFISRSDAYQDRYRALQAGADDFLSKDTPIRELLIRIRLLMTRYSAFDTVGGTAPESNPPHAFEGRVDGLGAPALVQLCHDGRLTGLLAVSGEATDDTGTVGFRNGEIVSASLGSKHEAEAVYAFLAWTRGHFRFTPGEPGPGAPLAPTFELLLVEGCRRLERRL